MLQKIDVFIIGAGPAGLTTAIQLQRYHIDFIIVEQDTIGGLVKNANLVENYLGYPNGISGNDLIDQFIAHIEKCEINVVHDTVNNIEFEENKFVIHSTEHTCYSNILVVGSGTKPKKISLYSEQTEIQERIFYEIVNIPDPHNKRITIIGAGDAAFDYALNLSKNNQVTIFNRSDKERCLPVLFNRAKTKKSILYKKNRVLSTINPSDNRLEIEFKYTNKKEIYYSDYILFAIGREPELGFLGESVKDQKKVLMHRNRLHFVGDVKNKEYRQIAIASGDGIKAAMKIHQFLSHRNEVEYGSNQKDKRK